MDDVLQAVAAARLLGRWILIAERHAGGCSCCPGLGDVSMDEIEGRVLAWLGQRYPLAQHPGSLATMLKECVHGKCSPDAALFGDLAEALDHLERAQAGL